MPGLLDFLGTDDAQLGLGLLAAGGPSATPMDFGQRIAAGVAQAQAAKDGRLRNKLLQSQIDENTSQAELRKAQIAKQAQIQGLTSGILGDMGGSAPSAGMTLGAPAPGAMPGGITPAQAAGLRGIPIERVAALKAAGGPDLIEAWKAVNVPTGLAAGSYAYTPGQTPTYMPDPSKGLGMGPNGVFVLPNAGQAQADLARATERAKAEEQARFQEATPRVNPDGSKSQNSRLQQYGGGITLPGRPLGAVGPGYAGGSASAAAGGQAEILSSELQRTQQEMAAAQQRGDGMAAARAQQDMQAIQRELQRLPGASATPPAAPSAGSNIVEVSPAQQTQNEVAKTFQLGLAKAAADGVTTSQAGAQSAAATLQNVQQIREGINKAILGPGANARVTMAQIGQVLGVGGKDSAEQLANTRAVIQGLARQELAAAGQMRGQGQITESEREILRKAEAGNISEFTKPDLQAMLGALERTANYRLSSHERTMQSVRAGADPNALIDVKRPDTTTPAAPKLLQTLPPANASNRGQRIRDTTTGKVLTSDGFQWRAQ